MDQLIPFNVPFVPEVSKKYMLEALESDHQQGDGPFTAKASKMVSNLVGGGHVLLTPSCTHALEMAGMLANIGPGDEVILPSFTFTSAATAITKFGAKPVFVDIDMETKGIDVNKVYEAISPQTKAISWVNYAGIAPDIRGLQHLAKEFNLLLIEDNAHGLGGSYMGKQLGSFGDFATQSFHATKNIQCGEGGALVINNVDYIERAEVIREKGTDRSKYVRGEVQKYQWVDQGSSYLLAESLAANLLGQLQNFDSIQKIRKRIYNQYQSVNSFDECMYSQNRAGEVAHMFFMHFKKRENSRKFIDQMKQNGILVSSHYQPLHSSEFGKRYPNFLSEESNAEKVSESLVRLPLWIGLSDEELNRVTQLSQEFLDEFKKEKIKCD